MGQATFYDIEYFAKSGKAWLERWFNMILLKPSFKFGLNFL